MENKTPQNRQTSSASRFADSSGGAPRRTAASARLRTTGAGAQSGHRPSGFAPSAPPKRQTANPSAQPKAAKRPKPEKPKREKEINNKRVQSRQPMPLWQKLLLIGLPSLCVLLVIFVLIFGGGGGTYHQLPKIERSGSSAFTPDETDTPGEADAPADSGALNDSAAFGAFFGSEGAPESLDGFLGGEGGVPESLDSFFDGGNGTDAFSADSFDSAGDFESALTGQFAEGAGT